MGKLAHDNEAQGSSDTVNDAVALLKFMLLSGEVCLKCSALQFGKSRLDSRVIKSNSASLLSTARSEEQDSSQTVMRSDRRGNPLVD